MTIRSKTTTLLSVAVGLLLVVAVVHEGRYYFQPALVVEQTSLFPINIRTADSRSLVAIPGIGPVLADRIIRFRQESGQFQSLDALLQVKGIGESRLSRMKPYICLIQATPDDNKVNH